MKKIKISGLIITLFLVILSCDESEDPAGTRGAAPVPTISNIDPAIFLASDVTNSFVEFDISLLEGDKAQSGVVQASLNGGGEREQIATISSFPGTVHITGQQVATALGISTDDIEGGDVVNLEVLTTNNGLTTRSLAVVNAFVACTYDPLLAGGSFHAYSDEDNWNAQGEITLEVDPIDNTKIYVTGLAAMEGNDEDQGPLVMHINLSSFKVTADHTVIATDYFGYTNGAFEGTGNFNSCDGTFTMYFTISSDEANFGTYEFILTKN